MANKIQYWMRGITTKIFTGTIELFLDQFTLDFPIVRVHTGIAKVFRFEKYAHGTEKRVQIGIVLDIQFWFIRLYALFTPVTIKPKKEQDNATGTS